MRRIRATKNTLSSAEKVSIESKRKLIIGAVTAVVLLIVVLLVVLESSLRCKFTIENNTDKNIKNIEVVFEDEEGNTITPLYLGSLNAGEKISDKFEATDFTNTPGDLWVYAEFEGEEGIIFYDGYLYTKFDGRVSLEFDKEDGNYVVNTDSGLGLFGSNEIAGIGSKILLDFAQNDWFYMSYDKESGKWVAEEDYDFDFEDIDFGDVEVEGVEE